MSGFSNSIIRCQYGKQLTDADCEFLCGSQLLQFRCVGRQTHEMNLFQQPNAKDDNADAPRLAMYANQIQSPLPWVGRTLTFNASVASTSFDIERYSARRQNRISAKLIESRTANENERFSGLLGFSGFDMAVLSIDTLNDSPQLKETNRGHALMCPESLVSAGLR